MLTNHSTVVAPEKVSLRIMGLNNKLRKILNGSNLILRSQTNSNLTLRGGKMLNQEASMYPQVRQPPYSPDMSPCDFPKICKWKRFDDAGTFIHNTTQ
jgi:hypothetical protein